MSPIRPVAKVVYVCDDIIGDPVSGKVSVLNLWDTISLPHYAEFPHRLPKVLFDLSPFHSVTSCAPHAHLAVVQRGGEELAVGRKCH